MHTVVRRESKAPGKGSDMTRVSFLRRLVHVQALGLCATFGLAVLVSAFLLCLALAEGQAWGLALKTVRLTMFFAMAFGGFMVLLYGAPAYALVELRGKITWPVVLALGAIPGLVMALWVGGSGIIWAGLGIIVSAATHFLVSRSSGVSA
ncbi:MAG TPA: hypothetical protein VFQ26_01885 [Nitrospiraceae bacterium]|nr:hypothetical protein [Nitrospiraceae bacterium]